MASWMIHFRIADGIINIIKNIDAEKFMVGNIAPDWGDIDHLFLRDNPSFRTLMTFRKITTFPNRYLDYFSDLAFENKISEICNAYNTISNNLDREYPYLNKVQADAFVNKAIEEIKNDLIIKSYTKEE